MNRNIRKFHLAVDRSKLASTIVEATDGPDLAKIIGRALGELIENQRLDEGSSDFLTACGITTFRLGKGTDFREIKVDYNKLSAYLEDKRAVTPKPFDRVGRRIVAAFLTESNFQIPDTGISLSYLPAHEAV